jgi:phospholipase C
MSVSRREFLAQLAIAAGATALGCRGTDDPEPEVPGIDHVIVVTMENRSFDHLLGWVPGADGKQSGLSYVDDEGIAHATHRLTQFQSCLFADPSHSFEGGRSEYNDGAPSTTMEHATDGFARRPTIFSR